METVSCVERVERARWVSQREMWKARDEIYPITVMNRENGSTNLYRLFVL